MTNQNPNQQMPKPPYGQGSDQDIKSGRLAGTILLFFLGLAILIIILVPILAATNH